MRRIVLTILMMTLLLAAEGRFSRSDDGIVTDRQTGLQWQDDYSDNGGAVKSAKWIDAITYCENLSLGGYSDWRLPNIRELLSITDRSREDPAIDPVFQSVASSYYWSSTTVADGTDFAWYVNFYRGYSFRYYDKNAIYYVRCVRGGQSGNGNLSAGLIAHYEFEGNANDSSGNGHNGTEHGEIVYVDGVIGKAAKFNNVHNASGYEKKDYITLGKISLGTNFTISHFVKFNGNAYKHSGATYSIGDDSGELFFRFAINEDGTMYIQFWGIELKTDLKNIDISDKNWHMITISVGKNEVKLYEDAKLVSSSIILSKKAFNNLNHYVSYHSWLNGSAGSSRFNGLIDDLRIYNRALNKNEIQALYNLGQ